MKNMIAKVLLISDLHKLSVRVGRQKGQSPKWYEKIINIWKWWNIRFAIPKMMRKIFLITERRGDFDLQIINGDAIECEYNERGITRDIDCRVLRKTVYSVPSGVDCKRTFVVPGDHELGYRLPLSSDPYGGISVESVDNFMHAVGPLWQEFSLGKAHFLLLSSSLMMQKLDHLPRGEQNEIEKLREQQKEFILVTLRKITEGKTVFVFLHDPDAIVEFYRYINEHYYVHNKNFVAFCGHMHADWSLSAYKKLGKLARSKYAHILPAKIRQWAGSNRWRLELFEKCKLQIIPAPGGMMGIGGGFKVMNIFDDGTYEIETHTV